MRKLNVGACSKHNNIYLNGFWIHIPGGRDVNSVISLVKDKNITFHEQECSDCSNNFGSLQSAFKLATN